MQIPDDSLKYPSPAFVATFVEVKGLTFDVDGASCHFVASLNYQVGLIVSPVLDTVMFLAIPNLSHSLSFPFLPASSAISCRATFRWNEQRQPRLAVMGFVQVSSQQVGWCLIVIFIAHSSYTGP